MTCGNRLVELDILYAGKLQANYIELLNSTESLESDRRHVEFCMRLVNARLLQHACVGYVRLTHVEVGCMSALTAREQNVE